MKYMGKEKEGRRSAEQLEDAVCVDMSCERKTA